ncbi:conserved protein of unknown function (plasmid) [Rhodovastum atsumiense]|uniref:Uncharacterized protein n=1 Tax=Rhodovastum atsumiense TaxID=504468 RepID=A0A5M6IUD0_9PROT|nr:hypothetical protein [Rhodovastum atsumiense]KAA5611841.1 hypothetical protein F1189_12455 [Rhodovastum atsumiense]CAH2606188.1 conserved protein of unknown function [Rhodovastum atsumiense]
MGSDTIADWADIAASRIMTDLLGLPSSAVGAALVDSGAERIAGLRDNMAAVIRNGAPNNLGVQDLPGFTVTRRGEALHIRFGARRVCTVDHDSVGWDGMDAVEAVVERIAKLLGVSVTERTSRA